MRRRKKNQCRELSNHCAYAEAAASTRRKPADHVVFESRLDGPVL
ncbi:MAG: hypothetical protein RL701_5767, partial [Pseudomonadota bacterium]